MGAVMGLPGIESWISFNAAEFKSRLLFMAMAGTPVPGTEAKMMTVADVPT